MSNTASLSNTASYVDIIAKTDTYVGCLPHDALERLLEKQPIVLLTLAKRLISLLSPLGEVTQAACPVYNSKWFSFTDRRLIRLDASQRWTSSMAYRRGGR